MGIAAFLGIVVVAILAGVAAQYLMKSTVRYEWLIVALAGAFGAYFASETFPGSDVFSGIKDWGPTVDGMYLIPAVVVGVILAIVADIGVRTGEAAAA
jgi:uncharacterized membrane protein YeaQ/YmgE (transglycosylase-associated protein family)